MIRANKENGTGINIA